jgi:hypothetical protein
LFQTVTANVDITMVVHNSIFDPLDGSASHRTLDSDIEIDELEFKGAATSVALQGSSRRKQDSSHKTPEKDTETRSKWCIYASGIWHFACYSLFFIQHRSQEALIGWEEWAVQAK